MLCRGGRGIKVGMVVVMDRVDILDSNNSSSNMVGTSNINSRVINRRSSNSSNSKVVGMGISYRRYSGLSRNVSVDELGIVWFDEWMYKIRGIWKDRIDEVGALLNLGSYLVHVLDRLAC